MGTATAMPANQRAPEPGVLEAIQHATDELLHRHETNVGLITHLLATALGLDETVAAEMSYAGSLHDVGRRAIADDLFSKVGPLNRRDAEEICRSEEHTSELQSLMRISYAVFCLKKKNQ